MRKDKAENISIVAKAILDKPLLRRDDIAKETWLWTWTVSRSLKELDENGRKDDRIIGLTDEDFDCIKLWVREIKNRLSDKEELSKMRTVEISQVIRENTARYSLFRWDATNSEWGVKEYTIEL